MNKNKQIIGGLIVAVVLATGGIAYAASSTSKPLTNSQVKSIQKNCKNKFNYDNDGANGAIREKYNKCVNGYIKYKGGKAYAR